MNILLFLKNLQGRGVSKVYLNLAKGFKLYGHKPIIVIREDIIDFDTDIEVIVFKENTKKNIDNLIKIREINFIISNNVKFIDNLKNINSNRVFYTVHMLWSTRVIKQLRIKKIFELKREYKNKKIIVDSNAVKSDLLNKLGIKPESIRVIHDIFDFENITYKSNIFKPEYKEYLLNIGAFSKEKNHKLLLEAYAKLNVKYDLVLIGSGPLENNIKELAKKLNISNKVHFLGFLKNPYPYIKHAKLTIMTSDNEGLPGVAIESLLLDTPLVSTDSKGIRDILLNEFKQFVCDKKDIKDTILNALNNYPTIDVNKLKYKYSFKLIKEYERVFNEIK